MLTEYDKSKIIQITKMVLDGGIDLISGCRNLDALRMQYDISSEDKNFLQITAFASDTDEFPAGEVRKLCNKDYLEKMDKELEKYLSVVKPQLLEACRNILKTYSEEKTVKQGSPD